MWLGRVMWLLGTLGWVLFWTVLAVLVIVGVLEFHVLSGLFDSGVTVTVTGSPMTGAASR